MNPEKYFEYLGDPDAGAPEKRGAVPHDSFLAEPSPGEYVADRGLRDAVNVALMLGQPLLLTGEPGTGKTQLARSLAHELGWEPVLKFETKSTSEASDVFYTYNSLARFHAGRSEDDRSKGVDYLTLNSLGLAIVLALEPDEVGRKLGLKTVGKLLPDELKGEPDVNASSADDAASNTWSPRRSVVLIDEIDKAPRDFPNDILNEIEHMYFRIPELDNVKIEAPKNLRPILILTSNSERNLPDPFLRRCVFYDIPFPKPPKPPAEQNNGEPLQPEKDRLTQIVEARLKKSGMDLLPEGAMNFFWEARLRSGLERPPATAELLGWLSLILIRRKTDPAYGEPIGDWSSEQLEGTLSALAKSGPDLEALTQASIQWLKAKEM